MTDEEYAVVLNEAFDFLQKQNDSARETYHLGTYERYHLDQAAAVLTFSDAGIPKVLADVQAVGTYSFEMRSWLWAWDNETIVPNLSRSSLAVRAFGEKHTVAELLEPTWEADENDAWAMTALTAYVISAKGAKRCPGRHGDLFVVFTDLRWASSLEPQRA